MADWEGDWREMEGMMGWQMILDWNWDFGDSGMSGRSPVVGSDHWTTGSLDH